MGIYNRRQTSPIYFSVRWCFELAGMSRCILYIVYSKLFRNQSFSSVLHHERRRARVKRLTSVYIYIYRTIEYIISVERVRYNILLTIGSAVVVI